jgi:hypothetical protein
VRFCVHLRSLELRGRNDVRHRHPQEKEYDSPKLHTRHGEPAPRRHFKVAAFLVALLAKQGPQSGQRHEEYEANNEVRVDYQNPSITAAPTSHSQGESAVTIRPPSRNPMGARLKRFRKKPV